MRTNNASLVSATAPFVSVPVLGMLFPLCPSAPSDWGRQATVEASALQSFLHPVRHQVALSTKDQPGFSQVNRAVETRGYREKNPSRPGASQKSRELFVSI